MVKCVKCLNPLIINIDAKRQEFKCRDCSENYKVLFEKKMLKICHEKKFISFFLNDLSNCDKDFSLKNVYEMYNKGYLDCVKSLNSKYNQSDNLWQLSLCKLKKKIKNNIEIKMNYLLNSAAENYECVNCNSKYSNNEALLNNFSCIMCSSPLSVENNESKISVLRDGLLNIDKEWSILP
ncbi:MAG: hypothetical protein PHG04_02405 [Candidatus Nanoarchaeia archaeon]|nr:hypothetical protein [Candidatus Nanoarchaeia archaeon]MDD5054207.1 hypothetical protein [Candidatus Nanoarchaeia archaeon]